MKYAEMSPEQKAKRNQQNAPSRARYEAKTYDKLYLRLRKDGDTGPGIAQIKAAADAASMSVNAWIVEAIKDKLNSDGPFI